MSKNASRGISLALVVFGFLIACPSLTSAAPLPDPAQSTRQGVSIAEQGWEFPLPSAPSEFPLRPLDRDPTEGVRHGWVQTTSGRFGFATTDLTLPARVSFEVGRVFDAGIIGMIPGVPTQEPRCNYDFGANWMLRPNSVLIINGPTTFLLLTDEGHVVPYQKQTGGTTYYPAPDRPLPYGPAVPTGDGGYRISLSNGLRNTYRTVPNDGTGYWITKQEDPSGNALNFTYSNGLLQRIDATDGSWVTFARPMWGASAPAGTNTKRIVRIDDSAGRQVSFTYNASNAIATATSPGGATWSYFYDQADHINRVEDPLGRVVFEVTTTAAHKTTMLKFQSAVTSFAYSTSVTTVTDPRGGTFSYAFDSRGNTTQITDAEGGVTQMSRHATTNDLTQLTEPTGGVHAFQHDSAHRITQYTAPLVDGSSPQWNFTYDSNGRLTRVLAPNGAASTFTYDTPGWLIKEATDPNRDGTAESETTYTRNATNGDISSRTDPSGRVTQYTYTSQGQLASVQPPCTIVNGQSVCPQIQYTYDPKGRATLMKWPTASGSWAEWLYGYNADSQLTSITDPLNHVRTIGRNSAGQAITTTAADGAVTTYGWRQDGQLFRIEDALGSVRLWDYNSAGLAYRYTDQEGAVWTRTLDRMGRTIEVEDPTHLVWKNRFNAAGKLRETETPGGRVVTITRDAAGRLRQRTLPGGGVETFGWDSVGNLTLMKQEFYEGSQFIRDQWTWTYNGSGLPLSQVQESVDQAGTLTRNASWAWDLSGRLTSFTAPDGSQTSITRDPRGRAVAIVSGLASSALDWDPWTGFLTRRYHADRAIEDTYRWNNAGRLIQWTESTGSELTNEEYTLDSAGRVSEIQNSLIEESPHLYYMYDPVGRLLSVGDQHGGNWEERVWNRRGELLTRAWRSDGIPLQTESYSYDQAGRVQTHTGSFGQRSFEWDFDPVDPAMAIEVKRDLAGAASEPSMLLLYDSDMRIRRVRHADAAAPTVRRSYRWQPGGRTTAVAEFSATASGTTTSDSRFFSGLGSPVVREYLSGGNTWKRPIASTFDVFETGSWRTLESGRRFAERDEGRYIALGFDGSGTALASFIGGAFSNAQMAVVDPERLAAGLQGATAFGAIETELASAEIDPTFTDDSMGLSQTFNMSNEDGGWGGRPWVCDAYGFQWIGCLRDKKVTRKVWKMIGGRAKLIGGDYLEQQCILRPGDTGCGGGKGSPSCGSTNRTQSLEPLRNPDEHTLGVTLSNGEYTSTITDLQIPGRDLDLALQRSYRTLSTAHNSLGVGWFVPLADEKIVSTGCGNTLRWERGDGSFIEFAGLDITLDNATNAPFGKIRRWKTATTPPTKYLDFRYPDGTIRRFKEFVPGQDVDGFGTDARPVRVTRPGSGVMEVDWVKPSSSECNGDPSAAWRAQRARLLDCDNESSTNPVSYAACTPTEIGRIEFDYDGTCGGTPRLIAARAIPYEGGAPVPAKTRKVSYSFQTDRVLGGSHLSKVEVEVLDGGGMKKQVASYLYNFESDCPTKDSSSHALCKAFDAAGNEVIHLEYVSPNFGATDVEKVQRGTVSRVNTPARMMSVALLGYAFNEGVRIKTATLTSDDRTTVHTFNVHGNVESVRRPDGSTIHYGYDPSGSGRLLQVTWPSGRIQKWVYGSSVGWGLISEQPVKYGEIPGSADHGEQEQWTCYDIDPLTDTPYRTKVATTESGCDFTPGETLSPLSTESIAGWQKAAPSTEAGVETTDAALEAYLDRWRISYAINPSQQRLPFKGGTGETAKWPWLSKVEETGRAPERQVNATTGLIESIPPTQDRPVTRYTYDAQGSLTRVLHPDGGETRLTYHGADPTALSAGTETGLGRLAQEADYDSTAADATLLRAKQLAYDVWGNVVIEQSQLDATRWIKTERTIDFQNRVTRETQLASPAETGSSIETRFRYDALGRAIQKRIETTDPEAGGATTFALVEYEYDVSSRLLKRETAWATATGADTGPWTGTGASSERWLAYDPFGNPLQEAVRISGGSSPQWRIVRHSYDKMNRRIETRSYADAWTQAAPPDCGQPDGCPSVSGPYTLEKLWFDTTHGKLIASQTSGSDQGSRPTTRYNYDGHERLKRQKICSDAPIATGDTSPVCGTDSSAFLSQSEFWYDSENRITHTKVTGRSTATGDDKLLSWTEKQYDSRGREIISRVVDSALMDVSAIDCSGATCHWRETYTGYDLADRAVVLSTPLPNSARAISKTEFDRAGRRRRTVDALLNETTVTRNLAGLPITREVVERSGISSDKRTFTSQYVYDGLGRPVEMQLQDGTTGGLTRKIKRRFDARGNVVAQWSPLGVASNGATGDPYKTRSKYDGLNRKYREERHIGAPQSGLDDGWQEVEFSYDDAGRMTAMTVEPDTGEGAGITAQTTNYAYDALGRRTKRTLPDGRVERTAYTALGQVQTTGFCNTGETACVELTNTYDHAGRRTALNATVPASLAAHYTGTTSQTWDYDGLNRVLKATDLNGAGSADDIVTRYSYDMLSRVPTQGWGENAGSALWNVTTEFDEAGRKKTLDYPVGAGWNATKLSYDYDALSRLTAVNDLHGTNPDETVSAFQYVGSRMIERSDSDGSLWTAAIDSATTRWDKAGRRTGAKVTAGAISFFEESIFYDADDRVTRVEWPNGLPVTGTAAQVYSYDELSRLEKFEQGPWNGSGFSGALSAKHDWTLDEQGNWNKHSDQDSTPGVDWTPPVDSVNAYTSWPTRVDYDHDGTIESNEKEKSLSLSYDAARAFLYEREESQGQYLLYRHDALGRLSTISRRLNGVETELVRYGYTADGRLAYRSQTTPSEELYLISDGDHVIIERTVTATQRTYIWAGATLLKSRATGGVELHLYQDRLGSVVLAMKRESGSTSMHGRAQYDPYGNNISNSTWDGDGVGQPYGYTGARWDSVAGLYLMGARWYAPEMGRFVELDPIGEGGGWNLYNYVGSSPTMWVDPTGLKWQGVGPPGHIQNPKYASSSAVTGGYAGPSSVPKGFFDGLDRDRSPKGPRSPIPCYVCDTADEDQSDVDVDDSNDEKGGEDEKEKGPTPEQKALSDAIARAATATGSVQEVVDQTSQADRRAIAGKRILIEYGKSDDALLPADDGGDPAMAMAFAEVEANAVRLGKILEGLSAEAKPGPLGSAFSGVKYDAAVIMGHNDGSQGGILMEGGKVAGSADAALFVSSVKEGGVVVWIACNGDQFASAVADPTRYHSGTPGKVEFGMQANYYVEKDKYTGVETSRTLKGFSAAGILPPGWSR